MLTCNAAGSCSPWLVLAVTACVALVGTTLAQYEDAEFYLMPGISYSPRSNMPALERSARLERRRPMRVPIRSHRVPLSPNEYDGTNGYRQPPVDPMILFPGSVGTYENLQPPAGIPAVEISNINDGFDDRVSLHTGDFVGAAGELELPEDLDVDNMDLNSLYALSNIGTIEDFARMFGIELPNPEDDNSTSGISARFGADVSTVAKSASCEAAARTVVLKLPVEINVIYFPRCVRLQRCGGCCGGPLLKCQPTQVEPVTLQVLRVESSSSSSSRSQSGRAVPASALVLATATGGDDESTGRSRRPGRRRSNRRRRQSSRYYTVHEENHVKCSCKCRVQETDCEPLLHDYISQQCQCRCKNSDEQGKCDALVSTHYWAIDTCKCYCLKIKSCSTGQYFDHASCSCKHLGVPIPAANGFFGLSPRFGGPAKPGPAPEDGVTRRGRSSNYVPVTFK